MKRLRKVLSFLMLLGMETSMIAVVGPSLVNAAYQNHFSANDSKKKKNEKKPKKQLYEEELRRKINSTKNYEEIEDLINEILKIKRKEHEKIEAIFGRYEKKISESDSEESSVIEENDSSEMQEEEILRTEEE